MPALRILRSVPAWPGSLFPAFSAPPAEPAGVLAPAGGTLRRLRGAALAAIGLLVTAATLVSFTESYRGLYDWALHHQVSGFWAAIWPLMVDVFIAVGELALFVALVDGWSARTRVLPWAVTLGGLAVSVSANVGHVAGDSLASRATAAVPPLAASAALSVGLGVLKRVARQARTAASVTAGTAAAPAAPAPAKRHGPAAGQQPGPTPAEVASHFRVLLEAGRVPSQAAIRDQFHVGSTRAKELRDAVIALDEERRAALRRPARRAHWSNPPTCFTGATR